jgi:uncharacterized phage protein (TIGR02218 family)
MKTASATFITALAEDLTFLCRVWEITLASAAVYRFTDLPQDITVLGDVYTSDPGITVSAVQQDASGTSQNATLSIVLEESSITEVDIRAGRLDNATFVLSAVSWVNTDACGPITLMQGTLSDVEFDDKGLCEIQIRGLLSGINPNNIGNEAYSKPCRARLGDSRCTKDLASVSVACTVGSVSLTQPGVFSTADIVGVETDGYFALGRVLWLTGDNAGRIDDCANSDATSGEVQMNFAPPYTVQVGDTFTLEPGCDKKMSTCKDKFNNLINFRGEALAPPPGKNPLSQFTTGFAVPNYQPAPQV